MFMPNFTMFFRVLIIPVILLYINFLSELEFTSTSDYRSMIQLPAMMFKYIFLYVKWVHTQLNSIKLRHLKGIHSVVCLAASTKTFNCSAAQKHIGYSPIVSMEVSFTDFTELYTGLFLLALLPVDTHVSGLLNFFKNITYNIMSVV